MAHLTKQDKKKDYKRIAWMCEHYFGEEDFYANEENIKGLSYICYRDDETEELIAFLLYEEGEDYFRGLRSGVLRRCRGMGFGRAIYNRMKKLAWKKGKVYKTYVSAQNLTSLNAHIRAGMLIEKVTEYQGDTFIHFVTKEAPEKKEKKSGPAKQVDNPPSA